MTIIITAAIICITLICLSFAKFTININVTHKAEAAGVEHAIKEELKMTQTQLESELEAALVETDKFNDVLANINKIMSSADGGK